MNFDDLVKRERIYLDDKDLHDGDSDIEVLIRVLQESEVLEVLLLCSNQITLSDGTFTDALAQNHTLRVLNLYNNKIGVEGATRLAEALKVNRTLQQIHLGWNHVGDKGAQMLADSFNVNSSLRQIWLNGNRIGDNGAHKLANALASNYSPIQLTLADNHISSDMNKNIKSIHDFMVKRDHEMKSKNEEIAAKDRALLGKEEELASKIEQIASLEAHVKQLEQSLASKDNKIASPSTPNLTMEKMEHENKRRRISTTPEDKPRRISTSPRAIRLHERNQKMADANQEKNAA
mmetsp:Transcript_5346/g.9457  ORF Transcript_5346/g.9457 Transcript_5346/m.9457 type:complete len:291 (+) Transcript_5346:119-991(+)